MKSRRGGTFRQSSNRPQFRSPRRYQSAGPRERLRYSNRQVSAHTTRLSAGRRLLVSHQLRPERDSSRLGSDHFPDGSSIVLNGDVRRGCKEGRRDFGATVDHLDGRLFGMGVLTSLFASAGQLAVNPEQRVQLSHIDSQQVSSILKKHVCHGRSEHPSAEISRAGGPLRRFEIDTRSYIYFGSVASRYDSAINGPALQSTKQSRCGSEVKGTLELYIPSWFGFPRHTSSRGDDS